MPPPRKAGANAQWGISSLKGGRNGIDPPMLIPDDQVQEAINVDWNAGALGRRRPGSDSVTLSGGTTVQGPICFLIRHVPAGSDETKAELWLVDMIGTFHRLAASTSFVDVVPKDAISGSVPTNATLMRGVVFNGKLFLLYQNSAGRPAVWDGTSLRRAGLAAPSSAPTAVTAGGAVTDTRTYKSEAIVQSGGVDVLQSELSVASGTVSLSAQQATLTFTGAPSEGETHWRLWGASTDGVYKLIGTATIGNTIVDNNASLTGILAPLIGTFSLIPDAVLIAKDGASRMLFGRHRTQAAFTSRIWFTPIFALAGDDERVPTITGLNNYFDLSINDGDFLTAIGGPLQNSMYAWKNHSTWKLTPTGDVTAPYTVQNMSQIIGCVSDKSVINGTDEYGQPCIYWWSQQGPYRIGSQGLQYMGRDIEDRWPLVNLSANVPVFGIFYPQIHQIWWWLCTGTNTDATEICVFDTILGHALYYTIGDAPPTVGVRRGWSRWIGGLANARCACMFGSTLGPVMGIYQKPYVGSWSSTPSLLRGDSGILVTDGGTAYQAYLYTKPYQPLGKMVFFDTHQPLIQAKAAAGVQVEIRTIVDWGEVAVQKDYVTLTPLGLETRVWRKFEKAKAGHARVLQYQIGDGAGQSVGTWEIDELVVTLEQAGTF